MPRGKPGGIGGNYPIWAMELPRLQPLVPPDRAASRVNRRKSAEEVRRMAPYGARLRCAAAAATYGLIRLPGWRSCRRFASNKGS